MRKGHHCKTPLSKSGRTGGACLQKPFQAAVANPTPVPSQSAPVAARMQAARVAATPPVGVPPKKQKGVPRTAAEKAQVKAWRALPKAQRRLIRKQARIIARNNALTTARRGVRNDVLNAAPAVGFNVNSFSPSVDYTNTNFTELTGGSFANDGALILVQDDTTNYKFYTIAMATAYTEFPANDTGHTADGSTGRTVAYQYENMFFQPDGLRIWCTGRTDLGLDYYDVGTAFDITTLTSALPDGTVIPETYTSAVQWAAFNADGTKLWLYGTPSGQTNGFWEYPLDTPYDPTSYTSGRVAGPQLGVDVMPGSSSATAYSFNSDFSRFTGNAEASTSSMFELGMIELTTPGTFDGGWTNTTRNLNVGYKVSEPVTSMSIGNSDATFLLVRRDASGKDSDLRLFSHDADAWLSRFHPEPSVGYAGFNTGSSTDPSAIFVSSDGTKLAVYFDNGASQIHIYTMSTPYDITTAGSVTTSAAVSRIRGQMYMSDDGLNLYCHNSDASTVFYHFTLGTAWDASTLSAATVKTPTTPTINYARGMTFYNDGFNCIYLNAGAPSAFIDLTLATAYDTSSDTGYVSLDVSTVNNPPQYYQGLDTTGTYLVTNNHAANALWGLDELQVFKLGTPWDITTAVETTDVYCYTLSGTGVSQGGCFVNDGTNEYLFHCAGTSTNRVFSYIQEINT